MRSSHWLKADAVVLVFFALGHTLGTAAPRVTRGAPEAAVFAAMQGFRFPVMGFVRSYWDFHRGFALIISVQLLYMAVVAWQLSGVSRHDPRLARQMTIVLLLASAGTLVISCLFFFGAPILTSAVSVICAGVAIALQTREIRGVGQHVEVSRQ